MLAILERSVVDPKAPQLQSDSDTTFASRSVKRWRKFVSQQTFTGGSCVRVYIIIIHRQPHIPQAVFGCCVFFHFSARDKSVNADRRLTRVAEPDVCSRATVRCGIQRKKETGKKEREKVTVKERNRERKKKERRKSLSNEMQMLK